MVIILISRSNNPVKYLDAETVEAWIENKWRPHEQNGIFPLIVEPVCSQQTIMNGHFPFDIGMTTRNIFHDKN